MGENMNRITTALKVAGTLFAALALAHVWRLARGLDIIFGDRHVPLFFSVIGAVVAGGLSVWMWRLASTRR